MGSERAIILSPGPSLAKLPSLPPHDTILAINSAVLRRDLPITHWICIDKREQLEHIQIAPAEAPPIITRQKNLQPWLDLGYRAHEPLPSNRKDFAEAVNPNQSGFNWYFLTILAALGWCAWKGKKEIVVFGADMSGTTYSVGTDAKDRLPKAWESRWGRERALFEQALGILREIGVSVRREAVQV